MADLTATPTSVLAVGDPARRPVGRAVLGLLTLSALFALVTLPAPGLPTMWSNGPWAQDPYHVVVSFAVVSFPLVAGLCMSRVPLCRRDAPLPTRRARDLLRISRILLILVLATAAGPDWLADVITLGERVCGRLGALRTPALAILRWTDRRVISGLRRYPLPAAAILAAVPGMAVAISQGVQEGYSPGGYVLFFMVTALGLFAFITIVGQHLGLVVDHRLRSVQ
jgi:hypothetical protein